ncbi:hypothetical protein ACQW02_19810 [Humitalea sp. 24SJ18S-53]|uniref:hypothetical protein n=1 Tax=Humitalea sp. 24SJ18S-53 TaxID=3422307 RepID=UPI003D671C72
MNAIAPFRRALDLHILDACILQVTDAPRAERSLDVEIYRALGWRVARTQGLRGQAWRCCSPIAATWQPLPLPTEDRHAASLLFPPGWSWSIGVRRGHPYAWCAERGDIVPGVLWAEANHLTVELAAVKAALYGHRAMTLRALERRA